MNTKYFALAAAGSLQFVMLAPVASADETQQLYNSSRNQLGLIKYCVEQGHLAGETAESYQKIVSVLPTPASTSEGDQYEEEGAKGNSFDGSSGVSMEDIAQGTGMTVADRCASFQALTNQ
jgi:hypothetical protein